MAAFERGGYDGLGFCFTPPYVGADLDGCRVNGTIEAWADGVLRELDSYTELSPSGDGVHSIVRGELPDGQRQKDFGDRPHHGVGLYDAARGRYFTMTGNRISGDGIIAERTVELQRIHARLFPPQLKAKKKARTGASTALPDDDLIARARKANDGGKFGRLWDGQWEGEYASQSEADLGLCMKLAFWTDRDAGRIDTLFRRSGLMRPKWDRQDYRERTIEAALQRQTETVGMSWLRERSITLAADAVDNTIEALNASILFHGRLQWKSFSRRGTMILGATTKNQQIVFPTITEVTSCARARAAIAEGSDVLLPQPPRNQVSKIWDPVAALIIKLAARDAIRVEHVLKTECRDLLILMWRHAGQPSAENSEEFMDYMTEISKWVRDKDLPAPPCVFTAEEFCWVHAPTFRNTISLSKLTNRLYPLGDIRQGLLLLGFEYQKDVTRGAERAAVSISLWRGPIDVLVE